MSDASDFPSIPALFDLGGRTVVVVGSASGLGQSSALGIADAGAHVVCADLDEAGAQSTVELIAARGGSAKAAALDVTSVSYTHLTLPTKA